MLYVIIAGLLSDVPHLPILHETIRGLYFHVPIWFGMVTLLFISFLFSVRYLAQGNLSFDDKATAFAHIGIIFGILGLLTGMLWAQFTWGSPWSGDPKQNAAAVALLIYLAYKVLRGTFATGQRRARLGAVYNIFAFMMLIPLLFVLPRLTDSLHPGNGGNPGFNAYDLDAQLRWVFYPAIIGWTLLGVWLATLLADVIGLKRCFEEK